MKKWIVLTLSVAMLSACGGKSKSGKEIAEEICDCSKKANALPTSDPNRENAQKECTLKAGKAWAEIKDDQKKADEYNAVLAKCAEEQIKASFGK